MDNDLDRRRRFLINAAYFSLIVAIYYVTFKYVIHAVMPFVLAALVTLLLNRPVDYLSRKLRIPRKGVGIFFLIVFYAVIVVGAGLIGWRLFILVEGYIQEFPTIYSDTVEPAIRSVIDWYQALLERINPNLVGYLNQVENSVLSSLGEFATWLSRQVVTVAQSMALGVPKFLLSMLFFVTATVFMMLDYPSIRRFLRAQFSEKNLDLIMAARQYLNLGIGKVILSYGLIMLITFGELILGLRFLIGTENFVAVAAIIAVFDILPVVGTGTIVIPWAIISVINGNFILGLKLLLLYGIVSAIRNVIEPKIVGESVGVHPVLMLISLFIGAKIFGPLGIIILPFTLIVISKLNATERIKLYKVVPKEAPAKKEKRSKKKKA